MRLNIDEIMELPRANRIKYVSEAHKALCRVKKMGDTIMESNSFTYPSIAKKDGKELKSDIQSNVLNYNEADSTFVKVVGNASNWIDKQMDMTLPGAPKKSIQENKNFIPFLKNHGRGIGDRIGIMIDIYEKLMPLKELGMDIEGVVSALIFEADIVKNFDEEAFWQYVHKQINQHSIALRYIDIRVCVDNENSVQEYENFKKYIKEAINPEVAQEAGFFFVIPEYQLIENSAVLFGANIITPDITGLGKSLSQNEAVIETPQTNIQEPSKFDTLNYDYLISNFKI